MPIPRATSKTPPLFLAVAEREIEKLECDRAIYRDAVRRNRRKPARRREYEVKLKTITTRLLELETRL